MRRPAGVSGAAGFARCTSGAVATGEPAWTGAHARSAAAPADRRSQRRARLANRAPPFSAGAQLTPHRRAPVRGHERRGGSGVPRLRESWHGRERILDRRRWIGCRMSIIPVAMNGSIAPDCPAGSAYFGTKLKLESAMISPLPIRKPNLPLLNVRPRSRHSSRTKDFEPSHSL